jgi:hypothetical protein
MKVTFTHVSDNLIEARDNWPAALRAVYAGEEALLSLAVPMDPTCAKAIGAFITPYEGEIPTDEPTLRKFLREHIIQDEIWVSAYKGFIKSRLAPAGKHKFKLHQVRKFTRRADGDDRIGITVCTDQGLETGFTAPWPGIKAIRGNTPETDSIEISEQKLGTQYLVALGLDLDKWEIEMKRAEALWPRQGVTSMFSDENDVAPEILQAVARHGVQYVQLEIELDDQYGLGPKREGQYHEVVMKIYATNDSGTRDTETLEEESRSDFDDERVYFTTLFDSLTKLVSGKDNALFTINGYLTAEGRDITKMIIVPLAQERPDTVKGKKPDGTPALPFPVTEEGWNLEGLHWLAGVAQLLMTTVDLSDLVGVVDRNDPSKIVQWAKENEAQLSDPLIGEVL